MLLMEPTDDLFKGTECCSTNDYIDFTMLRVCSSEILPAIYSYKYSLLFHKRE